MGQIQVVFGPRVSEREARMFGEALETRVAGYSDLRDVPMDYYFARKRTHKDVVVELPSVGSARDIILQALQEDLRSWRNRHFGNKTIEVK